MPLPFPFDFKNPDYRQIYEWRLERLEQIRNDPTQIAALKEYYKHDLAQFIIDWGTTFDPRNAEIGQPTVIPFLLFPRQEEYAHWFIDKWKNREPGICGKSREMGVSWLTIALGVSICLFYDGVVFAVGSRKEEYVDSLGDPKSLFHKAREFLKLLPNEFRGAWDSKKHSRYMKLEFPETYAVMIGEAGNNIGRGARASIQVIDESAHLVHPDIVDEALAATTNCRIDISTPHGSSNPFARKWFSGAISTFFFHWRDDPRKDEVWYKKMCKIIGDPVIIAQEIDGDFMASMEGVIIPATWVRAAVDAHITLKLEPKGARLVGFDVADEGKDKLATIGRYDFLVENAHSWHGKDSDIFWSTEKAMSFADEHQYFRINYDADGLGAGVRGDARVLNERRTKKGEHKIEFIPVHGSGAVVDPKKEVYRDDKLPDKEKAPSRKNEDFFENAKAQFWWGVSKRFRNTYRAITYGESYEPGDIISISSKLPELTQLLKELCQPTWTESKSGKIMVDKKPDGTLSPNLADALVIAFAQIKLSGGVFSHGIF